MSIRLLVRVLLLVGFGTVAFEAARGIVWLGSSIVSAQQSRRAEERARLERLRPPGWEPLRVEDYARFPRESFDFAWSNEAGNGLDTFRGIASKDLISLPDTTVALVLTAAEKDSVYEVVIRMRLLDPQTPFISHRSECVIAPRFLNTLRVESGPFTRTVQWYGACPDQTTEDLRRLAHLRQLIDRILQRHPEYRALPEARGFYL
jgi:hypothetical protein